jgi:hypothetical protein
VPRRAVVRLVVVLVPTALLIAIVTLLALTAPPARVPTGPQIPATPMSFQAPTPAYAGGWSWYNFTVTLNQPNLTWKIFEFTVIPGPLSRAPTNWSLTVQDAASTTVASYELVSGHWTTLSAAPTSTGETIVLETDSSLTMGEFAVESPSLGPGSWGVELS